MAATRETVIVAAVRTPVGRRGGQLRDWHPADLLAHTLAALVECTGLDAGLVDDVIAGCVSQVGEQSLNVARNAALGAGFPESVPGTTVDRQCGSSQQAIHFAAQGVIAGAYNIVIAGGVEVMTRVPLGSSCDSRPERAFGTRMTRRYGDRLVPQGISSDLIARKWGLSRAELDAYSLESHRRAIRAAAEGRFARAMVPVPIEGPNGDAALMTADEGMRPDSTIEKLASLKPAFSSDGVTTAGNSSQISDGAAALLIMERSHAEHLGFRPRARFAGFAVTGSDPVLMLTGPISATEKVLRQVGLTLNQVDLVELNEAFATVPLAWQRETGADLTRVNVNGGAIAIGHPLGSTGARLMTTLLNELERVNGRYGMLTMCQGGGMANATIIERLD